MRHIVAILKKQIKDTLKNKTILIQFIMFPALTLIMTQAVWIEGMPEHFFVNLYASMYVGMAPLTSMAAVIAEEKEKNTLRVLMLSNVRPYEYLAGIGSYIWGACMLGALVICLAGHPSWHTGLVFMAVMAVGILVSLLVGAVIGTFSRNQMMATSVTVPVMILFAFLPMLSLFNASVAKFARFVYSEQVSRILYQLEDFRLEAEPFWIMGGNMILFAGLFAAAYKRCGLE